MVFVTDVVSRAHMYITHNSSSVSDIEDLYTPLRTAVDQVPLHNFFVVSGDLSSQLGPNNPNVTYNKETIHNREYLIEFMKEFNTLSKIPAL